MQNKGIIGAVCGDIIGSAYEFHKTKDMNFKLFTPRSKFTDDTVMTCAVAEWLVDDPRHTHEQLVKIMHRYGDEFPHRGYGGMFGRWLEGHLTAPYNSFGNGSAMRVSPCGYYAKTLEEALELAQISAEVTHNHPEGLHRSPFRLLNFSFRVDIKLMNQIPLLPALRHHAWFRPDGRCGMSPH